MLCNLAWLLVALPCVDVLHRFVLGVLELVGRRHLGGAELSRRS
jgi:hypothetical protein